MDRSWLVDPDCNEDPGSESDPEETQDELESRLYSIIHHSDLSQPLPPELAKHYTIQCEEDGKLTVALNDSLENIKSEEIKKVDQIINDSVCDNDDPEIIEIDCSPDKDDIIVISESHFNSGQCSFKRFRYSDVNIDSLNVSSTKNTISFNGDNGINDALSSNIDFSKLNFFKAPRNFFRKKQWKKYKYLVIPDLFEIDKNADWKDSANESFISVGDARPGSKNAIIDKMVCALQKVNPNEKRKGRLYTVARALYSHNINKYCKHKMYPQMSSKYDDETLINSSHEESSQFLHNKSKYQTQSTNAKDKTLRNKDINTFDGSFSLNISPFKPVLPTVDLISENEDDTDKNAIKTNRKWKCLPKHEIPTNWTKKMIKFYTKPSKIKMTMELNDIFESLKKTSSVDDWRLDPKDKTGFYQGNKVKGKHKNRRCPNCHQKGHLMHDCPSPRKVATCFLCGLNYHSAYSCPHKICLKCGINVSNDSFECEFCYYNTFDNDTSCGVCDQVSHRTDICPDLWRSFHATVEGEKKVPKKIMENKRKYCCNCANKGHFSHQCPFPSCEGEHISSFVTNYAASSSQSSSTEIIVPSHLSHILESGDTDRFLQNLSNSSKAVINIEERPTNYVFQVCGTFAQCSKVRNEIEGYINTKKRKRDEPYPRKKRRRVR